MTGLTNGNFYKFKIWAINIVGYIESNEEVIQAAAKPGKPVFAPWSIVSETSSSFIYVEYEYDPLNPTTTGGSPIVSYELQVYDIDTGLWVSLIGSTIKKSLTTEFLFS